MTDRGRGQCLLAVILITVAGCDSGPGPGEAVDRPPTIVSSVESGGVSIEVETGSLQAESGEPIEITMTLKAPESARARFLIEDTTTMGDFDVLGLERAPASEDVLMVAERRRLLVSTFESGTVTLPPIRAHHGDQQVLVTEPIEFEITSLIEGEFDPTGFAEIRGPVDDSLPGGTPGWLVVTIATTGGGLLLSLAIALLVARRRRPRPRIPHEWALAEFARIRDEDPSSRRDLNELYERIERVLRWYLSFQFGIDAPDRTSKELLGAVTGHERIIDDARAVLERLVRDGDRIKFAGGVASRGDCDRALESACTFVRMTVPPAKEEVA